MTNQEKIKTLKNITIIVTIKITTFSLFVLYSLFSLVLLDFNWFVNNSPILRCVFIITASFITFYWIYSAFRAYKNLKNKND